MTYAQKLKDPRWQRKRLEIFQRDDFTCRVCQTTEKTLHVHHVRYIKGREPWEYREFYLVTLCEDCHQTEENELKASILKLRRKPQASFDYFIDSAPEAPSEVIPVDPADPEELEAFFASLKGMLDPS